LTAGLLSFLVPPSVLLLATARFLVRRLKRALTTQPERRCLMARLITLAAVAASLLSAAFLAGLTCGG
jgi:hypothetical protein